MPNIMDYLKARAEKAPDPDQAAAEDYEAALREVGVSFDEED